MLVACSPNAVIAKNVRPTDPLRVVAARDIRAGEEVNISYIDVDVPRSSRQITLKKAYNFTCCCARCALLYVRTYARARTHTHTHSHTHTHTHTHTHMATGVLAYTCICKSARKQYARR